MSYSLGDVLKEQLKGTGADVSKLDTSGGREQIEYIPLDRIDSDPRNFYKLGGLEQLAASIELLGLQQPLRVRQNPDAADRVVIVSGHRRRAALQKLVDEGRTELREVPCIRETAENSAALQELRLIYANSDTRVLTAAELSKQAARVEELLYLLKEEGMEFPGRMRDQVAAACNISAPKLARLKVIREKLVPEYMQFFEKDHLPEQTAYALARLPEDFQKRLASVLSEVPSGRTVEKLLDKYNEGWRWEPELQCPDGKPCKRGDTFLQRDCETSTWKSFCGGKTCCLECEEAKASYSPCERMCSKAKAQRKAKKDEAEEAAHKRRQKEGRKYQKETQVYAKRLLPAIDAAGLPEDTEIPWRQWRRNPCISQVRQWAAGEFDDPAEWHEAELVPEKCDGSLKTAKLLGCSTDFLMGLTDDFRPPTDTEAPPQEGPALETDRTEAGEPPPAPEEPVPEGPSQNVSNLDTISGGEPEEGTEEENEEEPPARRVRWESWGRTPPEGRPILTYAMTNDGPVYRAVVWEGGQFKSPNGKKFASGLQYTKWLEVPPPASGEEFQLEPPEQAEGQLVISGWMPGGTFPRQPCEVVADLRITGEEGRPDSLIRSICWFDGADLLFKKDGPTIDAECVRWMVLPSVEEDVSKLDTNASGEERA